MEASILAWATLLLVASQLPERALCRVAPARANKSELDSAAADSLKDAPTIEDAELRDEWFESELDESGDKDGRLADESDGPAEDVVDAAEGSRSTGGIPDGSPPKWLGGSWFQKGFQKSQSNNLFSGFMVRLNDHHVLAHRDTCQHPEYQYSKMLTEDRKFAHEQVTLGLKPEIDTQAGPGGARLLGCDAVTSSAKHLTNDLGIYKLTHAKGLKSYNFMQGDGSLKERPTLQHDPTVTNNCYLHSYSGKPGLAGDPVPKRTFSKFPVKTKNNCKGSICNFISIGHDGGSTGEVCPHLGDAGAPIMCGEDRKLSFLTIPEIGKEAACGKADFKAFRIADHHQLLSDYTKMNNTLPQMPTHESPNCDLPPFPFSTNNGCIDP